MRRTDTADTIHQYGSMETQKTDVIYKS